MENKSITFELTDEKEDKAKWIRRDDVAMLDRSAAGVARQAR